MVRFQFQKVCEHWDNARHGPGRMCVIVLAVGGVDGRKKDNVPFRTDGRVWWADVPARELGCPGQCVSVMAVMTVGARSGRGLSVGDFVAAKGRQGMSFGGVAAWELV